MALNYFFEGVTGSQPGSLSPGVISLASKTSVTVNLTATEASGGTAPYAHQWQRALSSLGPFINVGTNSLSLADSGLTASTTYYYRLVYTDAASDGVIATYQVTTDPPPNGELPTATYPDYLARWVPPGRQYFIGEVEPMKWVITRQDEGGVPEPSAATIVVTLPDGTTQEVAPAIEPDSTEASLIIAGLFSMTQRGKHEAQLTLALESEVFETRKTFWVYA